MAKKKTATADEPQITHFESVAPENQAIAATPDATVTGELDYLRKKLFAAEEVIDAHNELLECYLLHRPRNKSIDALKAARKRFEEVVQ